MKPLSAAFVILLPIVLPAGAAEAKDVRGAIGGEGIARAPAPDGAGFQICVS